MKQVRAGTGQSIWDLANRYYGSVNGIEQLMIDNPGVLNLSDTIAPGTVIKIDESKVINKAVADYLETRKINPSSAAKILTPELTFDLEEIDFATQAIATISDGVIVHVSGKNLQGNVVVSVDAPFVINIDGSTNNHSPITLYQIGGVIEQDIYVRFKPPVIGPVSGKVQAQYSEGVIEVNLNGEGI